MSAPRLSMVGIRKRFGATVALSGVDLEVAPREVHALVGENGAGKSTLMKILSGAERPDAGTMSIDGVPYAPGGPLAARAAGVAMIYQELNLAPHLTVEQNMTLGMEHHVAGIVRSGSQRQRVRAALARLDRPDIRPDAVVGRLAPAERQLVEIARALLTDARIIVMDEPTSSLGAEDIEHLVRVIAALRDAGVSIIYISHFLEEVRRVADRFTVLRDGSSVGGGAVAQHTPDDMVTMMIGRKLDQMFPRVPHEIGGPLLRVESLAGDGLPIEASLTLHRGEILGIAGLVGAGRTEMLRTLFGLATQRGGQVRCMSGGRPGERTHLPARATPSARLRQGIGLLSEDRRNEGLAAARTVAENILLSRLGPLGTLGWVRPSRMRSVSRGLMDRLSVRSRGPETPVRELSGGNQQKVALARLLHHDVDVLLLDEPTRGIDVASKAQIYQLIGALAARGKAILMVSSYTPELLGVCDRIAVMHRGRLGPARPVSEWTEHAIIAEATSGRGSASPVVQACGGHERTPV